MDILVGSGPSFVMRQGQMEIKHGCKVLAVDDLGDVMFLEKPSHRSLLEVAKVVVAHLKVCGVSESAVKETKFVGVEQIVKLAGLTVTSTLSLPELLSEGTRTFLVNNFHDFIVKFWAGRVL